MFHPFTPSGRTVAGVCILAALAVALTAATPLAAQGETPVTDDDSDTVAVNRLPYRGIIPNWVLLGPFPTEPLGEATADGVTRGGFDTDYLDALGGETEAVIDLGTTVTAPSGEQRSADRATPLENGHVLHRPFDKQVGYAFGYLVCDADQDACLLLGSDGSPQVWVNGRRVLRSFREQHKTTPHEYVVPIRLNAGRNRVLIKLDNARQWWGFQTEVYLARDLRLPEAASMQGFLDDFTGAIAALSARLDAADGELSFLHARWHAPYRAMIAWVRRWMDGAPERPTGRDLTYWAFVAALIETLENERNIIALNPGCEVPLLFDGTGDDGEEIVGNYAVSFPKDYETAEQPYALVVHLGGSGGLKTGLVFAGPQRVSQDGPAAGGEARPYVLVTPNRDKPWHVDYLNVLLDAALETFHADADRVCVTGESMGGFGAWDLAMSNPERLAAIMPCAAYANPLRAERLRHVPVWVVHGEKDPAFPPWQPELMVSALRSVGADVRYDCFAEAGHGVGGLVDREEIDRWLLDARRKDVRHPPDPLGVTLPVEGAGAVTIGEVGPRRVLRASFRPEDNSAFRMYRSYKSAATELYNRYRASGRLAETFVEMAILPSKGEGDVPTVHLVLPIHEDADPAAMTGPVERVPARRYAEFTYNGPETELDAVVERIRQQLIADGHTPTGERWDVMVDLGFGDYRTLRRVRLVLQQD